MSIIKQPFVNYRVGEPDPVKEGKIFTIRLNSEEYTQLIRVMAALNVSNESTAIKQLSFIGQNVIFSLFPMDSLKWLSDGRRRVDESKIDRLQKKIEQNVTQKESNL
jgi:hypothetical protein